MKNRLIEEIGSEFWSNNISIEETNKIPMWLSDWGNVALTSSGRGSISLMLDNIEDKVISKKVLLPSYICGSVIEPFIKRGYICEFYDIDSDLKPIIDVFHKNTKDKIGIFLHLGYFGFPTNKGIKNEIIKMKAVGTFIVEDITHSMFSNYSRYAENDFYIGSIRKWLGIPSGGFLATNKYDIKDPQVINHKFIDLRKGALFSKYNYIKYGDESLKRIYLKEFSIAEEILDEDPNPYRIDKLSNHIINKLDEKQLIYKRRQNYLYLMNEITRLNNIEVIFQELEEGICPLFFPIKIKKNRDEIRKRLSEEKIYCPIHWPIPTEIKEVNKKFKKSFDIYDTELSIPCDQRYSIKDMEKIVLIIKLISR